MKLMNISKGDKNMRLIDADEFKKQIIAAGALFNAGMDKINVLI